MWNWNCDMWQKLITVIINGYENGVRSKDNTGMHLDINLWFREFRRKVPDSSKKENYHLFQTLLKNGNQSLMLSIMNFAVIAWWWICSTSKSE